MDKNLTIMQNRSIRIHILWQLPILLHDLSIRFLMHSQHWVLLEIVNQIRCGLAVLVEHESVNITIRLKNISVILISYNI